MSTHSPVNKISEDWADMAGRGLKCNRMLGVGSGYKGKAEVPDYVI